MHTNSRIFVAGHRGLVGSAIVRSLEGYGYCNIITALKKDVDLRNETETLNFFESTRPDYVFLAAAHCGGIGDTIKNPVHYLEDNLKIQTNVITSSFKTKIEKLMLIGSASVYPRDSKNPIKEESLLCGKMEPANEPYGLAKIVGIKLCQAYNQQYGTNYISVNPCNVYGPKDNYDPESSHVIAGLIRRIHEAKKNEKEFVECWGTGISRREFIYVEDLADALVFLMNNYNGSEVINVGVGKDVSIKELVAHIVDVIEYSGEIRWDTSKPQGITQRLLDTKKLNDLGWKPKTSLDQGLKTAYEYFKLEEK